MKKFNEIFDRLDEWKKLPSYQLERRFDIFLSLYLPQLLEFYFKKEIDCIIPEFPIRTGDYNPEHKRPNKSFKIDYLALCIFRTKLTPLSGEIDPPLGTGYCMSFRQY
ncbi:MAG: hypothetical protein FJY07_06225 [Bacteroidetes bacterium]|nr:hypothetical protein [Bacteroidota bacterium]